MTPASSYLPVEFHLLTLTNATFETLSTTLVLLIQIRFCICNT
jgi:hypothetical protein